MLVIFRLCSGQVVLSMASAVKELVENALDSGATNIEIKFQEYGSKVIEVIDNGKGVTEENFAALTLKHHTSKIMGFEDVSFVTTFGFRGEALSSLCAVSRLSITTRHQSSETGTRLDYDHNGAITYRETYPRHIGTSVKLTELFCTMPVRLKEFHRNLKKEFSKMVHHLHAYCLISTGVRITCININDKGKRSTIFNTGGHDKIVNHICEIFGASQITSLKEIHWSNREPFAEILADFYLTESNCANKFQMYTLDGYISTCEHGKGRNVPDRQFFFINNRPCDIAKASKLVNEIYHQFNRHQYPFVMLNIKTESLENVDVNVTPDKRLIFLESEKLLLATIKSCLLESFGNIPSTYACSTVLPSATKPDTTSSTTKLEPQNISDGQRLENIEYTNKSSISIGKLRAMFGGNGSSGTLKGKSCSNKRLKRTFTDSFEAKQPSISQLWNVTSLTNPTYKSFRETKVITDSNEPHFYDKPSVKEDITNYSQASNNLDIENAQQIIAEKGDYFMEETSSNQKLASLEDWEVAVADDVKAKTNSKSARNEVIAKFSIKKAQSDMKSKVTNGITLRKENYSTRFLAQIDPNENGVAEDELKKEIKKDDFLKMKIFGQFNRGFIIAGLKDDLFIIDQHASDEKVCSLMYRKYE